MRKVQHLLSVQHSVRCFVVRIGSHLPSRPGMSRVFIHAIVPSIGAPLPKFLVHCGRIGVHWKVKLRSHLDMETSSVHDSTYDLAHVVRWASLVSFSPGASMFAHRPSLSRQSLHHTALRVNFRVLLSIGRNNARVIACATPPAQACAS